MYKCNVCGKYFSEPIVEAMEQETGYVEQMCPHCGSDYFEEAHECPLCHDAYTTDDYCDECYNIVREGLEELKATLGASQDEFEQIISNHFGW